MCVRDEDAEANLVESGRRVSNGIWLGRRINSQYGVRGWRVGGLLEVLSTPDMAESKGRGWVNDGFQVDMSARGARF